MRHEQNYPRHTDDVCKCLQSLLAHIFLYTRYYFWWVDNVMWLLIYFIKLDTLVSKVGIWNLTCSFHTVLNTYTSFQYWSSLVCSHSSPGNRYTTTHHTPVTDHHAVKIAMFTAAQHRATYIYDKPNEWGKEGGRIARQTRIWSFCTRYKEALSLLQEFVVLCMWWLKNQNQVFCNYF